MIFLHNDLVVRSMKEMMSFYHNILGMEVVEDCWISGPIVNYMSNGFAEKYRLTLLKSSIFGAQIELIEFVGGDYGVASRNENMTFLVNSIDETVNKLQENGIMPDSQSFTLELHATGRYKLIFFRDPEGNRIEFLEKI